MFSVFFFPGVEFAIRLRHINLGEDSFLNSSCPGFAGSPATCRHASFPSPRNADLQFVGFWPVYYMHFLIFTIGDYFPLPVYLAGKRRLSAMSMPAAPPAYPLSRAPCCQINLQGELAPPWVYPTGSKDWGANGVAISPTIIFSCQINWQGE